MPRRRRVPPARPVDAESTAARRQSAGPGARRATLSTPIDSPATPEPTCVGRSYFHLHLVSDSTGETLITVARAAAAQYEGISAIEHVYPLVRSHDAARAGHRRDRGGAGHRALHAGRAGAGRPRSRRPAATSARRTSRCSRRCIALLQSYLGAASTARPGAQHMLNAEYFKRIDAMNFTLLHDDGQLPDDLDEADVVLVGVSRTSKTPTAIYLANRGIKTANIPLVPGRAAARGARDRRASRWSSVSSPARSASSRSARTGCSACKRRRRHRPMSTAMRWPRRSPSRAGSARATTGR